jgi:GGDEF domain-containing protein
VAAAPAGILVFGWSAIVSGGVVGLARERGTRTLLGGAGAVVGGTLLLVAPIGSGFAADLAPLLAPRWLPAPVSEFAGLPEAVLLPGSDLVLALLVVAGWKEDVMARAAAWATIAALGAVAAPSTSAGLLSAAGAGVAFALAAVEEIRIVAFHDPLTGLPARRALEAALAALSPPYVVAMVDVDHFKRFNDTFGHAVGDQVLAMVAARLGQVEGARAFRYGGEEFTLLFAGRTVNEAAPPLELARAAVEATTFRLRAPDRPRRRPAGGPGRRSAASKVVAVTISIGAASPEAGDTPRAVLAAADQALYRAKGGGRNRIAT